MSSGYPLIPEVAELFDVIYAYQADFITSACSYDAKIGCKISCSTQPCEPSEDKIRTVVLLPAEREYLERRLGEKLRFLEKSVKAVNGTPCPYKVEGRCTLGPNGSMRPFACRTFPIHFSQEDVRAISFYLNTHCLLVRDPTKKVLIKEQAKRTIEFVLAMWLYLPPVWWEIWNESRSVIQYKKTETLSFELYIDEKDVVDFSVDKGNMKVPLQLAKMLSDDDCMFCENGVSLEGKKLNRVIICPVCAGPRYWNKEHYEVKDKEVRGIT